jgi:cytochrome c-type biogenesis protein CcmH/NrfG
MIFSLLTLPIDGFKFILNTIVKVAEEQWTDDAPLKQNLLELQVLLENGDINEEQYIEAEAEILRSLREVQERKRELAGADIDEKRTGLSGKVQEGSGASVTFDEEFGKRFDE